MTAEYLKSVAKTTAQGDAREESYYSHFSNFLGEFSRHIGKIKAQITTLPKKTEAGNPDFRVWDGKQHIVGYIEAKKPGENLDVIETSKQLKRYRSTFPNLILKNKNAIIQFDISKTTIKDITDAVNATGYKIISQSLKN